jgi:IclR family transcriptional regulator, pca regulon regulatory protein
MSTKMDEKPVGLGPSAVKSTPDKEFMTTLAKGMSVLGAFGEQRPSMTLSGAATAADLSRATARRILRTLTELGYVVQSGRNFSLAPRILELGFAYLSTQTWIDRAEPLMKELSHSVQESCSAAILQGTEIVYVARMPAPYRIMSTTIAVGSRLPAFHTSLGRAQLGFLAEDELWRRVKSIRVEPYTANTITDVAALIERIKADRAQGFAIVDEELEKGLRSIAVPILTRNGRNVGAINLSAHTSRTTRNEMRDGFLPQLRAVAKQISRTLT